MEGELVFTVDGAHATPAIKISLAEAGLKERDHLQEWVLANPNIIGNDVLIVSMEFDRWISQAGVAPLDRLDVLGLDRSGRLVVAELKRDRAPDTVDMQALKYAAMVSRFSLDTLATAYAYYLKKREEADLTPSAALARLQEWAPDLSDETLRSPKICLIASDFPSTVTATTVFLHENGLDISLTRVQAYRTSTRDTLVTASQVWPIPTVDEFTISPRSSSQAQQQVQRERKRRASIVEQIVAAEAIPDNSLLQIVVPPRVGQDIAAIQAWLDEDPQRSKVLWRNDIKEPVVWLVDEHAYSPTSLITELIRRATGQPPQAQVWAPNWLQTDGKNLFHVVQSLGDSP